MKIAATVSDVVSSLLSRPQLLHWKDSLSVSEHSSVLELAKSVIQ